MKVIKILFSLNSAWDTLERDGTGHTCRWLRMELCNPDFLSWQQYLEIVRYCSGSSPSSAPSFQSSAEWEKLALSPCSMWCFKAWSPTVLFNIYILLGEIIQQHGVTHLQLWLDYWGGYLWLLTEQHTSEQSGQFGVPVDLLLQPTKQVVAMVRGFCRDLLWAPIVSTPGPGLAYNHSCLCHFPVELLTHWPWKQPKIYNWSRVRWHVLHCMFLDLPIIDCYCTVQGAQNSQGFFQV